MKFSYYNNGFAYHDIYNCTSLEAQLVDYPVSRHWDEMDCLGHITQVMESQNIYFDLETADDFTEDYSGLEYEEPLNMEDYLTI